MITGMKTPHIQKAPKTPLVALAEGNTAPKAASINRSDGRIESRDIRRLSSEEDDLDPSTEIMMDGGDSLFLPFDPGRNLDTIDEEEASVVDF